MRLLSLLLVLACNETSDAVDKAGSDSGESGALAADAITAVISDKVHTVAIVTWTTSEPTTGYVEFGTDTTYGLRTASTASGTEHRAVLLGTTADTEIHFRVVVDGGQTSADYTITTLSLPSGIPEFVVSGTHENWKYVVAPTQGTEPWVVILNNSGKIVWYYQPAMLAGNLMKSVLSHQRGHVILAHAGTQEDLSTGVVEFISLDGYDVRTVAAPNLDHDLVELPDGTVAYIEVVPGEQSNGAPWAADRITELAPDGTTREVWNAWDQLDPEGYGLEMQPNWTHGNGLEYVPWQDAYYLAIKGPGSVVKIDRASGTTDWLINGLMNQFEMAEGTELVMLQHQFEILSETRLLLFDNGLPDRGYSRAVELEIDTVNFTAEQVWEYIRVPPVYVFAKGDVHRYDDGRTMVTWSAQGEIQLVESDGTLVWQLNAPLGQAFTFVQPFDSFYADE